MASDEEALKRHYKEFLDLMPLTLAMAGLSPSESMRNYTPEQMELRGQVIANAFRVARQTVREAIASV
jgi:hypothetical protein